MLQSVYGIKTLLRKESGGRMETKAQANKQMVGNYLGTGESKGDYESRRLE